jgi:2-haloacid dehalogenase
VFHGKQFLKSWRPSFAGIAATLGPMTRPNFPRAALFDLLTALVDSWTLWNIAACSAPAGRAWRAEYLRLTYGCGAYVAYEKLVRDAARTTGLSEAAPDYLEAHWGELIPWSGAQATLDALQGRCKLAVVTNCSARLGALAAQRFNTRWDAVITAEEAGFYKPDPRAYRMALDRLGVAADEAVFVAGSAFDLVGTAAVGLRTYWHNRVGLTRPDTVPPADCEATTFDRLIPWMAKA